jgi:hypothetical protein
MKTEILYARTVEGVELPIVDATNAEFAVAPTEAELSALCEEYVAASRRRRETPAPMVEALKSTRIGRGLMAASGTYLDGMTTYLLKVGAENLGESAHPIDRQIAASFPGLMTRVRLQDMARLLAESLTVRLVADAGTPVCLINIGGGVAADSWNALIQVQREQPGVLAGRAIVIAVLDVDSSAAAFGARAVAALTGAGAPLEGLNVELRHVPYSWAAAGQLAGLLDDLGARDAACLVSSEGGLFEYGSDAEILANLEGLREADAVVGSVTRDGEAVRESRGAVGVTTRPRSRGGFEELAKQAGWRLGRVVERAFSYHVTLRRG